MPKVAINRKGDAVFPHQFVLPRPRPSGVNLKKRANARRAIAVGSTALAAFAGGAHLLNKYRKPASTNFHAGISDVHSPDFIDI